MYGRGDEPTRELALVRRGPAWWRNSGALAVVGAFAAVVVIAVVAFVALRPDPPPEVLGPGPGVTPSSADTPSPSATPSPSSSPTPSPRATRPRATVVPIPTQRPPAEELPPPAPPQPSPGCTNYREWDPDGDAPEEAVRAALAQGGARVNWRPGVFEPKGWPAGEPYPDFSISADLMNAVAFAESSWRSTVIACDGGIGLMQLMPDNVTFLNDRFNRDDNVSTVEGNAALGAMYLQWLRMYFGLYYYGTFDLDAVEEVGSGGAELRLRDVIVAAYNVGFGNVENLNGTPKDGSDDYLVIPNQWYVDRVNDYVQACPCDDR